MMSLLSQPPSPRQTAQQPPSSAAAAALANPSPATANEPSPPAAQAPAAPPLAAALLNLRPDIGDEGREQLDQLAGGFRPVAASLAAALGTLRRTIPLGRTAPPHKSDPQAPAPDRPLS